jgi:SAM-dependent methyltransferase
MLDAAALRPGERVLDVGCGHGTSTIAAAERVAPGGRVVGVDISAAMLEPARQAAAEVDGVEFLEADAQVHPFPVGSFDSVISQFGTMFFADPGAALGNLRRALRPAGRLAFVCWQEPLRTGWIAVSMGVAVPLLGRPPDLGDPGAPGPYAFADGNRLRHLVTGAGFESVTLEPVTRPQPVGDDVDDAYVPAPGVTGGRMVRWAKPR